MSNKNNIGRIPETGAMTAYERWELPSLDDQDEAANEIEIEPVTAEEVEHIRQEAYQDGLTQGQEKGYQEGFSKGEKEGLEKGLAAGKEEGTRQGLEEGKQAGLKQGQHQIDTEVKKLADMMSQFEQPLASLNDQVQSSLLNVITAVSRTVIHRELQMDSSQVTDLLKQGLQQMESTREQIEVTVNPSDLLYIENAAEEAGADWKISADENMTPGGLTLKSGASLVDLTAEQRFQQAILNLLGRTDWAIDLAAGKANDMQKALSSLSDGYEVPDINDATNGDDTNGDDTNGNDANGGAEIEASDRSPVMDAAQEETPVESESVVEESDEPSSEASEGNEQESVDSVGENPANEAPTPAPEAELDKPAEQAQSTDTQNTIEDSAVAETESTNEEPVEQEATAEAPLDAPVDNDEPEFAPLTDALEDADLKQDANLQEDAVSAEDTTDPTNATERLDPQNEVSEASTQEQAPVSPDQEASEEVFDFDASDHDENMTVYPENQKASDLLAQEEGLEDASFGDLQKAAEEASADTQQEFAPQVPESQPSSQEQPSSQDLSSQHEQQPSFESNDPSASGAQNAAGANVTQESPEVKSMMQPMSQGNGFSAFGWQTPQAQQAQAHAQAMNQQAQQAQMQAQAATAQAQQAQMQAHQAQAQAQQAQAHAQAMNHQAQSQMNYQPQYMPQQGMGQPMQPGMAMQPGIPMQPGAPMQPGVSMQQNYQQQGMPMQQAMMQPMTQTMPMANLGTYQGMPVQPVPLVPSPQGNFSAFSYSTPNQGANQPQTGFAPYQYPVA